MSFHNDVIVVWGYFVCVSHMFVSGLKGTHNLCALWTIVPVKNIKISLNAWFYTTWPEPWIMEAHCCIYHHNIVTGGKFEFLCHKMPRIWVESTCSFSVCVLLNISLLGMTDLTGSDSDSVNFISINSDIALSQPFGFWLCMRTYFYEFIKRIKKVEHRGPYVYWVC